MRLQGGEAMSTPSLYHAEERLTELLDTEGLVPSERLAEFAAELTEARETAIARRDAVIHFIRHVEGQIEFARAEEKRISAWRKATEEKLARFQEYVARIIEANVPQPKKGVRKLEAHVGELRLEKLPDSVEITDPTVIPAEHARVTVQMPEWVWGVVVDWISNQESRQGVRDAVLTAHVNAKRDYPLRPIKEALQRGEDVPGADLKINQYRLVVK
jgi:hypothetical protein